jgi:PAP2 superfamily
LFLNVRRCKKAAPCKLFFAARQCSDMMRIVLWGIAFCLSGFVAFSQTEPDSIALANSKTASSDQASAVVAPKPEKQNFVYTFFDDEAEMWTSPFHMNQHDALLWGGIAATTAIAIGVDEPVSRDVYRFRNEHVWVQTVSPIATQFGQFYVPYGIAALYCLDGWVFEDDARMDTGLLAAQAMLHSGIIVQVLKHMFGRSRPFVYNGRDIWYGPRAILKRYEGGGFSPYDSFPSGHTITAFSLAAVIAEREPQWVGVIAYTCAGLCGVSRITQHDHWLSDVIVGGALGVAIGKFEVDAHQKRYSIYPTVGLGSAGVLIQFD